MSNLPVGSDIYFETKKNLKRWQEVAGEWKKKMMEQCEEKINCIKIKLPFWGENLFSKTGSNNFSENLIFPQS